MTANSKSLLNGADEISYHITVYLKHEINLSCRYRPRILEFLPVRHGSPMALRKWRYFSAYTVSFSQFALDIDTPGLVSRPCTIDNPVVAQGAHFAENGHE